MLNAKSFSGWISQDFICVYDIIEFVRWEPLRINWENMWIVLSLPAALIAIKSIQPFAIFAFGKGHSSLCILRAL